MEPRLNTNVQGIYRIRNKINDKSYVGSAVVIRVRWWAHRKELRGKYHHSPKLQNAWNKYGEENFEFTILEIVENVDNLLKAEQYWIDWHNSFREGYNCTPFAGHTIGTKRTEESKTKMRKAREGFVFTEEHRQNISKANMGHNYCTPEMREATSKRMKGNSWCLGKKHTPEALEKMRLAQLGKTKSPEHRRKLSEAAKRRPIRSGFKNSPEHRANLTKAWAKRRKGLADLDKYLETVELVDNVPIPKD